MRSESRREEAEERDATDVEEEEVAEAREFAVEEAEKGAVTPQMEEPFPSVGRSRRECTVGQNQVIFIH